jgi:TonB family protein
MTAAFWLRDLVIYGLQSTLLVGAGAALARLLRIHDPKAMLAYWRTLLLACLLLPFCQPWKTVAVPPIDAAAIAPGFANAAVAMPGPVPTRWPTWPLDETVLVLVASGIAARGAWLAGGALGLRRLRRTASPLVPRPRPICAAEQRVGVCAEVRVSNAIAGPITFGAIRPVIVFPPSVLALDDAVQEAIACHELLHVRRGDWVDEIVEEAIRTILWFHPAARWLIGRIQLSREQVVDHAVIELTESRDRYVDALMAVALTKTRIALLPAPPFVRRRLLKTRIASIFQENTMSTRRLIISLAASAAALVLAAVVSVRLFPLQARGEQSSGAPVQIVTGAEHLLHSSLPEYPRRAIERGVQGDVLLEVVVDDRGQVSDARVLSGPDELRKAALASVLEWHYAPDAVHSTVTQATVRFHLPPANAELGGKLYAVAFTSEGEPKGELSPSQRAERVMMEIEKALQDPGTTNERKDELLRKYKEAKEQLEEARSRVLRVETLEERPFEGTSVLTQIRSERISPDALKDLTARLGVHIGDAITEQTAKEISRTVSRIDEHLRVAFHGDGKGGIVMTILAP